MHEVERPGPPHALVDGVRLARGMRQPRILGYRFQTDTVDVFAQFNETFRLGAVKIDFVPQKNGDVTLALVCSTGTWSALQHEERRGGTTPTVDILEREINEAVTVVQARMVDLNMKGPRKVVDRRTVTRPSNDRVEFVCRGIADLTSQMATLMGMPEGTRSDNQITQVAKRYAELAGEMSRLRTALTDAEGQFEVAQQQIMALMGGDE